jgi:pimeloyl-ACP methyl ester carboxylesterase
MPTTGTSFLSMKRPLRIVAVTVLALAVLAAGVVLYVFGVSRGRTPPIVDAEGRVIPGSIASLETHLLGGAEQWVLIRGRDSTKPVLLFLHGGPGMPAMYLAHAFQRGLEREFLVVHWDRRGAGKSFSAAAPRESLTVRRTLEDTYELTLLLRRYFGQPRIYLVGHSWGSYLGLLAVREHPEYYAAFIGVGQVAGDSAQLTATQREFLARHTGDATDGARFASSTGAVGAREDDLFRYGGELYGKTSFRPLLLTGLRAPEYTLMEAWNVRRGAALLLQEMKYDVEPRPYGGEIAEAEVPVFFLLGRHDYVTPSDLAASYLDRLKAPLKGVTWFERSAHFPFFEEPERFRTEMVRIRDTVALFWAEREPPASIGRPPMARP